MNKNALLSSTAKKLFGFALKCRRLLPPKKCDTFGRSDLGTTPRIDSVQIINLLRQPFRLNEMRKELEQLLDFQGKQIWELSVVHVATDARDFMEDKKGDEDIEPWYTLSDQLFVEPQPLTMPTSIDLNAPIGMSRPEVAVALSHIAIWKKILAGDSHYTLILEDDVWFKPGFSSKVHKAWLELHERNNDVVPFDILYLSFDEVKNGAPKTFVSQNIFCPERGLWNLSGYVLSRAGAEKLLKLLPCRGPVDLWMNKQFQQLQVRAIRESVIRQRPDFSSTNSYSILPSLTKIGAINSETAALFQLKPLEKPVFVFGSEGSGLTSVAMALSMLGYRCCGDLKALPEKELNSLLAGSVVRIFDAYVNIGFSPAQFRQIINRYPSSKVILTGDGSPKQDIEYLKSVMGAKGYLQVNLALEKNKWQSICEFLRCSPPSFSFPAMPDQGQRRLLDTDISRDDGNKSRSAKWDESPWIVPATSIWAGINLASKAVMQMGEMEMVFDELEFLDENVWSVRNDTFTGNLGLFRSENVKQIFGGGISLSILKDDLGVRDYSAAAITSQDKFLYGRFEAVIKASSSPGVITGFFLHRDSPRQEIDVEISGHRPDWLMVNVYYNPGDDGARYDYGYRGASTHIELGFDASKDYHLYAIEWLENEIRWYVDDRLVHSRVQWDPTPIPHLPMFLHINLWPSLSRELAGGLKKQSIPASAYVRSIKFNAHVQQIQKQYENTSL